MTVSTLETHYLCAYAQIWLIWPVTLQYLNMNKQANNHKRGVKISFIIIW